MAWIRLVRPDEATGSLARQYKAATGRAGKVFEIVQLHSLMPDCMRSSMMLYQSVTTCEPAPLERWMREAIATVVSRTNDCFY